MVKSPYDYRKDYGWRTITPTERAEAIIFLDKFTPKTEVEERDKVILEYFCRENISAQAIVRKNDKRIICFGNRAKGHPLTVPSILRIIYKYFPQFKKQRKNQSGNRRVEHIRKREKELSQHQRKCAFCGGDKKLEEHHMIPLFMGGDNANDNMIFLCHECHLRVTAYQRKLYLSLDGVE